MQSKNVNFPESLLQQYNFHKATETIPANDEKHESEKEEKDKKGEKNEKDEDKEETDEKQKEELPVVTPKSYGKQKILLDENQNDNDAAI